MSRAELGDSGNYTCVPDNAPTVNSLLHVIEGTDRERERKRYTDNVPMQQWSGEERDRYMCTDNS